MAFHARIAPYSEDAVSPRIASAASHSLSWSRSGGSAMTTVYHGSREYAAIDPAEAGRDNTTKCSARYLVRMRPPDDRSREVSLWMFSDAVGGCSRIESSLPIRSTDSRPSNYSEALTERTQRPLTRPEMAMNTMRQFYPKLTVCNQPCRRTASLVGIVSERSAYATLFQCCEPVRG